MKSFEFKWHRGRVTFAFALLMLFSSPVAGQFEQASRGGVVVKDGRLSVSTSGAEPDLLLEEIAAQAQIELITYGEIYTKEQITVKFDGLPLEEGVRRILKIAGIGNYVMQYRGGKITEISFLGQKQKRKRPGTKKASISYRIQEREEKRGDAKPGEDADSSTREGSGDEAFDQRMSELEGSFSWSSPDMLLLIREGLEVFPDAARGEAVDTLKDTLEKYREEAGTQVVDQAMVERALFEMLPKNPALLEALFEKGGE
jgi:hypothetical protein